MGFCPVPHTSRDQAWLGIGALVGAGLVYFTRRPRPECPQNVSPLAHGPVRVCVEFNDVRRPRCRSCYPGTTVRSLTVLETSVDRWQTLRSSSCCTRTSWPAAARRTRAACSTTCCSRKTTPCAAHGAPRLLVHRVPRRAVAAVRVLSTLHAHASGVQRRRSHRRHNEQTISANCGSLDTCVYGSSNSGSYSSPDNRRRNDRSEPQHHHLGNQ